MTTDFRVLCEELMNEAIYLGSIPYDQDPNPELIARARAALAHPEPMAPTDEELLKLLSGVSGLPDCDTYIVDGGRIMSEPNELLAYARSVLARWRNHS